MNKMKNLWTMAALATAATTLWAAMPGCGPSIGAYCNEVCDCQGCSDKELDECVDNIDDAKRAAENEGCSSQFDAVLSCAKDELTCQNDIASADGCESEAEELYKCSADIGGFGVGGSSYCNKFCDCSGCSSGELEECVDSLADAQQQADSAGCGAEFNAFVSCYSAAFVCIDGEPTVDDDCQAETNAYGQCASGGS